MIYEVWNKPKDGPLTVQERAEDGVTLAWLEPEGAINRAKQLKKRYPHMDFLVRSEEDRKAALVYDTSKDNP
jgi:hypothetical protein